MATPIWVNASANSTMENTPLADDSSLKIFQIILMVLIIGSTVLGNTCICWIIVFNSKLRQQTTNKLVMNLCWCDLLTAVVNGPVTISVLLRGEWDMGGVMCNINGFTTSLFGLSSILTLAVISLNRCLMISYPTKYSYWFTNLRTNFMITGIWVLSALFAIPPVFGWSSYVFIAGKSICTIRWSSSISYTLFVFIPTIFFPFFLMIASYYKIFITVKASSRRIESHNRDHKIPQGSSGGHPATELAEKKDLETTDVELAKQNVNVSPPSSARSDLLDDETSCARALTTHGNFNTAPQEGERGEVMMTAEAESARISPGAMTDNLQISRSKEETPGIVSKNHFALQVDASLAGVPVTPRDTTLTPGSLKAGKGQGLEENSPTFSFTSGRHCSPHTFDLSRSKTQRPRVEDVKITKTVLIVLLAFIICWSPITIVNFIETFFIFSIPVALDMFTVYMVFISCAINPLIFGLMNRNFRKGFRKIFCSCRIYQLKRQRNSVAIAATKSS